MKIYTGIGDRGTTCFFGCGMVGKDDPRIEAFGALDELNSVIGLTISFCEDDVLGELLAKVQNDLFQVGADLVCSRLDENNIPRIREEHIKELEVHIDAIWGSLPPSENFVLPGGTKESSFLHLCRATTRRAERTLVRVGKVIKISSNILIYVNRLSDLLYALARQSNNEKEQKEQQPIYKYFKEGEKD